MHDAHSHKLKPPMNPQHDHVLGDERAQITLLEFGSYTCPYCHAAHAVIADLRDRFGDRMRYVFRHRPTSDDAEALRAARLAEYAHATIGKFWEAHDALIQRGPNLQPQHFAEVEQVLGLPAPDAAHQDALQQAEWRVQQDIESALASGALFTPTFFINNRRYEGPWDENSLSEAMLGSLGQRVQTAALDFARWAPSTGVLLLIMSIMAVIVANAPLGPALEALWHMPVGLHMGDRAFDMPLREWINEALLTIFFLVVGLEIKREFTVGRLATRRSAALPVVASIGGMLVPALIYLLAVPSGPLSMGWAIPTTTDTAFAVALIAVLGRRVPVELRVFLTAAVIVDDLVAIAIVAVFYSGSLQSAYLGAALVTTGLLMALNRSGVYRALPYALLGIVLWGFLHCAGLHATLAGVILAVVTPTRPPANLRALLAQANTVFNDEMHRADETILRHGPSEPTLRALDAIHDRISNRPPTNCCAPSNRGPVTSCCRCSRSPTPAWSCRPTSLPDTQVSSSPSYWDWCLANRSASFWPPHSRYAWASPANRMPTHGGR